MQESPLESAGEPEPSNVAAKVAELADLNGCQIIMIDGLQAWKHTHNGHAYQRDRERKLNIPAKIGLLLHVGYYSYPINILSNIFP